MKFLRGIFAFLSKLFSKGRRRSGETPHYHVIATSFADPADVRAFRRCKERGGSDQDCFKVGDNAVGLWGDYTAGPIPMCALPPERMVERWGSINAAKHKKIYVSANGKDVVCILADRMPHEENIKNGAGVDLNPAAVRALGLAPPVRVRAIWNWL